MDQRGSLKKALGQYATDDGLEQFKINVTEVLTQHASAILLDPEWGLPAARRALRAQACCWPMRRPATTRHCPAACLTCSIYGPPSA